MNHPAEISSDLRWADTACVAEIESPALLFYPERIAENIRRMVVVAKDPERLRPHVKTHKTAQVVDMKLKAGISKFKCATIAEAEMIADCGGRDVLLAYQPVGPNIRRLRQLSVRYPSTTFSTIVDSIEVLEDLGGEFGVHGTHIDVLVDLDCGMQRTGIPPDQNALDLCHRIDGMPGLEFRGLHVYDGHIHSSSPDERRTECATAFGPVQRFLDRLRRSGLEVRTVVAGGTPTFPFHAENLEVECSPGTCVLWDYGYSRAFPDLDFLWSALVLTRVVAKPGRNRLCLDLGNKAIASEGPHPRVYFPEIPDSHTLIHAEEHLLIETRFADKFNIGDPVFGVPKHICPTCALHREAVTIEAGKVAGRWSITARDRHLVI